MRIPFTESMLDALYNEYANIKGDLSVLIFRKYFHTQPSPPDQDMRRSFSLGKFQSSLRQAKQL